MQTTEGTNLDSYEEESQAVTVAGTFMNFNVSKDCKEETHEILNLKCICPNRHFKKLVKEVIKERR